MTSHDPSGFQDWFEHVYLSAAELDITLDITVRDAEGRLLRQMTVLSREDSKRLNHIELCIDRLAQQSHD